jgi:L-lactate dehydrogenase complex protein LldG
MVGAGRGAPMSAARDQVLGAIRSALGRGALPAAATAALDARLAAPTPGPVPVRGQHGAPDGIALFVFEAERVNATTERLASWDEVPARIAAYLRAANRQLEVRVAPDPALARIPWDTEPTLTMSTGAGRPTDAVAVTSAFAGVAETGTLVLLSGPESPTTLNFLPTDHIVVMPSDRIVGSYEDAWSRLRAQRGAGALPRVVNWITGPSRTADIEQTLLLGAHGPRRLHILLIDGPGH